jgi:recombination protein RecA
MSSLPVSASYSRFLPGQLEPDVELDGIELDAPEDTGVSSVQPGGDAGCSIIRIDKKAVVLRHIAGSERLTKVLPACQLNVRPRPEMISTGISELDASTGGIPCGCLTGVYGAASSGKTSVLLTTIATATRREEACALIDASDSFDPSSGAAAGMNFHKLLWVRCSEYQASRKARNPNSGFMEGWTSSAALKLEQVLKTTDLVLQSGGFGLVALDLAGIPDKFVRRIPLASWFRFQRAVEHTKTALLVISEFPCAQTCAALAIKLSAVSYQLSGKPTHTRILESMQIQAEVERSRLERKPVQSVATGFRTQTVRAG